MFLKAARRLWHAGPLRLAWFSRPAAEAAETRSLVRTLAGPSLQSIEHGVLQWDAAERLVAASARIHLILRLPPDALSIGLGFRDFVGMVFEDANPGGHDAGEAYTYALSLIRRRTPMTYDLPFKGAGVLRVTYQPLADGGWLTTYEDITGRQQAQARLAFMQRHDPLTRLVNRTVFQDRLQEALARVRDVAVLVLDLDRFTQVNDTLGSAAGDTLLQYIAGRLNNCVRTSDTVARLGSDEFAVMLVPGSHDTAVTVANHVTAAIGASFEVKGSSVTLTASMGVALAPADGDDADSVIRNAHLALNAAKADGQGACRFFDPSMAEQMRVRWEIETDLRAAVTHNALELFYQPIISTLDGRVSGLEALMRWRHPQRGYVAPDQFVPVAEATRLIVPIGAWSIQRACEDLMILPEHLRMAVNLSVVQLGCRGLVQTVRDALTESGIQPDRLELEVTETAVMQDPEAAAAILDNLHELGVRIALDDFGTGYSSLAYIRNFSFDKVKIDKSFIHALGRGRGGDAIVRAIAGIASSLGIETVAEGVETEEQYRRVVAAGCDRVQGFLVSRPVPLAALPSALAAIDAGQWAGQGQAASARSPWPS